MQSHGFWSSPSARVLRFASLALLITTAHGRSWAKNPGSTRPALETPADGAGPLICSDAPHGPARRLSGVVADQTAARIPQAQITLSCGDFRTTVSTDAAGAYALTVPSGNYLLRVEAPNFNSTQQLVSVENTTSGTEVNLTLRIGQVGSSVTVSAANEYATTETLSGTKTELPLNEVPQAITAVNRQLMDAQDVVKLDDALKNVAGVMPGGYYDGWDYYRIRGFDASFNTYIDGLRGGNGMMEETWGLESVEVLKGPSSALYGQSVLGGLVNIVTRKPVPDNFAHIQMTGGTFKFLDPAVDVGGSLNSSRTLFGRMAGLYHSANTFVDHTYRHRYYLAPSLTWRPTPATSLTLIGRAQRDNGVQGMPLPAIGTVTPGPTGTLIPISRYIGELNSHANQLAQANQQFGYQFRQSLGEHFTLRQNARFAWYQQHWNRIYYPSYLAADNRTLYRYALSWDGPWQTHEVDTNMEAHGRLLGMEHSALLGFDFFRQPGTSVGWIGGDEPLDLYNPVYNANPYQPLVQYTSSATVTQYAGIYLQDHIRLPHNVTITGGGRLEFAKNQTKGSPNQNSVGQTPRLGVTWQFIPSTTVYASFSRSFLPQSGQTYVSATQTGNIPPERGKQWEGGLKSSYFNGRLLTTLAVFQLNRTNVATTDVAHPNFMVVAGEQRSRGVELEATVHPMAGWNITSAYSYVNAVYSKDALVYGVTIPEGTPTLNAPKHIFNLWTTYEIPRGTVRGLRFGIGGRHYTDQAGDTANSFRLPQYGIADASVTYQRGPAKWQLNVNNLGNKRYYAGSYSDLYVKPGEPRVIRGTMSWNF